MKPAILIGIAVASLGLGACREAINQVGAHDHAEHVACTFKEGAGLELSTEAAKHLKIQTQEVAASGNSARVPASAVLKSTKGDIVYVQNGGRFLRTPVVVSGSDGDHMVITEGLYEGDVVVVSGTQLLWLAELQAVNGGVGCADGH
jgi:hypothetical protein